MRRSLALSVVLAVVVGSCGVNATGESSVPAASGTSSPSPPPTTTMIPISSTTARPVTTVSAASGNANADLVTGVATHSRMLEPDEWDPLPATGSSGDGDVSIIGCRWRAPSLYSFDLEWSSQSASWPMTALIALELAQGDQGTGWIVEVTMAQPGQFSVPLDMGEALRLADAGDERSWSAFSAEREFDQRCSAVTALDTRGSWVNLTVDPLVGELPDAGAGTVQGLVSGVSLLDQTASMLPLAWFITSREPPVVDRLYLAPDRRLTQITVERRSPCVRVSTSYGDGDDETFVTQAHDCQLDGPLESLVLDDGVWQVTVRGPGADELASELDMYTFEGVPLREPVAFDADALLDTRLAEIDAPELARLPWMDGLVSIVDTGNSETGVDTIAAVSEPFNGGGSTMVCEEYIVGYWSDGLRGYGYAVTSDPTYRVGFRSPAAEVALTPAEDGRGVGIVDLSGDLALESVSWYVLDSSGDEVTCTQ